LIKNVLGTVIELLTSAVFMLVFGLTLSFYLLYAGIRANLPIAWAILGALAFALISACGAGFVLFIQWVGDHREANREKREQERFNANAKENLSIMQAVANTQAAQARMLSAHQSTLTKSLPAPGETVDADYVAFDESLLTDLDAELS
jgi:membrane protein implicated in regulation of membrane protease activity